MQLRVSTHFLRFSFIGAFGTAVHFAVLVSLVESQLAGSVLSSQVGAVCGAVVNYLLNRRLNYATTLAHHFTGPRFATVATTGFVLNGLCMSGFADGLKWNYVVAQCMTTAIVLLWNFLLNHYWTFRRGR